MKTQAPTFVTSWITLREMPL